MKEQICSMISGRFHINYDTVCAVYDEVGGNIDMLSRKLGERFNKEHTERVCASSFLPDATPKEFKDELYSGVDVIGQLIKG